MKSVIQFKLLREGAKLPKRATEQSGAFDIYAPCDGCLEPGEFINFPIGVAHQISDHLHVPLGFRLQGLMIPRSGFATRHGIRLFYEGLIDHDYRGEIHACLENASSKSFEWKEGERICQIVYILAWMGPALELEGDLEPTDRGAGGFGSTGR